MRLQRVVVAITVVAFAVGSAAPASAGIEIKRITFNPKGKDTGTNKHLKKEVVVIHNTGSRRRSLDGWRLHDSGRDHLYRFDGMALYPGSKITLRTGRGDDLDLVCPEGNCPPEYTRYWNLRNYVWDNTGDVAILRKPSGKVVDRCRYGRKASSPKRC